ncbi:hypothetical protein GPV28_23515, partial [Salmonella enterica subsp. enterica serovar Typhimurium]|nr:hypothetical protein [Salmonella enterica subsp. enterica serovar Typhimurium]
LAESVGMLPCNLYHLNGSLKQRASKSAPSTPTRGARISMIIITSVKASGSRRTQCGQTACLLSRTAWLCQPP